MGKELLGTKWANIKININKKINLLKNEKMLHFGRQHWDCCLPVIAHTAPTYKRKISNNSGVVGLVQHLHAPCQEIR